MKKTYLWALLILIIASLACNLPFLTLVNEPQDESDTVLPDSYKVAIVDETVLEPVALSGAQRQVLLTKGSPNRFTLMFTNGVREETWYYDHLGYDVTFRNGDVFTENDGAVPVDAVDFVTIYFPWQFNGEMGLSGLLMVTGSETFARESLEDAFQEDVSLVYLKGLDAGIRGDDLLFVRAIPIGDGARTFDVPVRQPTEQSQPDADLRLTAAEIVHAGSRSYDFYCVYSDGLEESFTDQVSLIFTEDGVYYNEESLLPKFNDNRYGFDDDAGGFYVTFQENAITLSGGVISLDGGGNEVVLEFVCVLTPVE